MAAGVGEAEVDEGRALTAAAPQASLAIRTPGHLAQQWLWRIHRSLGRSMVIASSHEPSCQLTKLLDRIERAWYHRPANAPRTTSNEVMQYENPRQWDTNPLEEVHGSS